MTTTNLHILLDYKIEKQSTAIKKDRDLIEQQAEVRNELKFAKEDFEELERGVNIEMKKVRSKFSSEELLERQRNIAALKTELDIIAGAQRVGYVDGYKSDIFIATLRSDIFETSNISTRMPVSSKNPEDLSQAQQRLLSLIRQRDAKIVSWR